MPSDEELMLAVGRGDLAAFGEIVSRHQATAWNLACRFLGDATAAEDVAQDAFLRILDAAPRYRPTASFRTYLHQVVVRLCLDYARRKRTVPWEGIPAPAAPSTSPLDALVSAERHAATRRAVEALPANQRMAVVLRYYEGMASREAAEAMGTTPKAVERLLARARDALGAALRGFLEK